MSQKVAVRKLLLGAMLAGLVALVQTPAFAEARLPFKSGTYNASTTQQAVSPQFRAFQFTLKKGKVTLTSEPVVANGVCVSAPVFTLDQTPRKKLSKRGAFTFTHTYLGNRFDKISGRFVSATEVQGFAIYHFQAQDLCAEAKIKVNFTAQHA
jgi:hypothetical protein